MAAARAARIAVASGCPADASRTPSTSSPAVMVKNPNTRSGAWMSAATLERKNTSRVVSAAASTTSPADAMASSARDSQDGPSRNVPSEMMPVAMTNAKQAGCRSRTAVAARPRGGSFPPASVLTAVAVPGLVGNADLAPPAAAGAGLGGMGGDAAAEDDVGPPQVPQRDAPGVDQAAERPHRPDQPRGHGMHLADNRRAR